MLEHMKIWKTVLIVCLWMSCSLLAAEFITPAQALNISGKWIRHFQPKVSTSLKQMQMYLNGEFFFISEQRVFLGNDDLPELYLVSFIDDTFAILPADDNLPPILAYATKPLMVGSTLPSACCAIMEAYASSVRHCRITSTTNPVYQRQWQQLAAADFSFINSTREVNPLIDVTWNQGWPYNELCPADPLGPGGHVPVGCLAVAMAQLIKYWNHPLHGNGSNSYNCSNYGYQSANFGDTVYQWDLMPPVLSTPNLPVATLMYHCGVSINMQYSVTGSGAYGTDVPDALRDYFSFPGATYLERADYSDSLWTGILRDQLDQGFPLYYS